MDVEPPRSARLLLDFGNTLYVDERLDTFESAAGLADWLAEHGLSPSRLDVTPAHLRLAVDLRQGLRATFLGQVGESPGGEDVRRGEAALRELPLVARLEPAEAGQPAETAALVPASDDPVRRALSHVASALVHVMSTGDVNRLKQCPNGRCGLLFWDRTRSRTRRWCSMRVCGNRAKARRYAARQRASSRP